MTVAAAGLRAELSRLAGAARVRLALAAGERDGLVMHAAGAQLGEAPAVAALFASLYRRARAAAAAQVEGDTRLVRMHSVDGEVLVSGDGETVVVVVADRGANLGSLRLEIRRAIESLA